MDTKTTGSEERYPPMSLAPQMSVGNVDSSTNKEALSKRVMLAKQESKRSIDIEAASAGGSWDWRIVLFMA